MESEKLSVEEMVEYYKPDVQSLTGYIPWLEAQKGNEMSTTFQGEGIGEHSITFPVYDTTLMNFVKTARASSLIDRNYVYVYSRYGIRGEKDEHRLIKSATIKEMGVLWGILSRYIIKGMTKGTVWAEGVRNGIYLERLCRMKEILDFWDREGKETR